MLDRSFVTHSRLATESSNAALSGGGFDPAFLFNKHIPVHLAAVGVHYGTVGQIYAVFANRSSSAFFDNAAVHIECATEGKHSAEMRSVAADYQAVIHSECAASYLNSARRALAADEAAAIHSKRAVFFDM